MQICRTIEQARAAVAAARRAGKSIGVVPTMGALHEGHFSLVKKSCEQCDVTVVTIFVNPSQFGPNEDLAAYPRTFEADQKTCEKLGADMIFAPLNDEMYQVEKLTWVNVEKLGDHLCGSSRPAHFRGVCTVVAKLFNIIGPDRAYFGQKDAQQLAIIQRMVRELNFPVEIVPCPTVREADGLAMSSRNVYLTAEERKQAPAIYESLKQAKEMVGKGAADAEEIRGNITEYIQKYTSGEVDYISIVDMELLQPVEAVDAKSLIALAVRFGKARLIDNIVVDPGS